MDAPLLQEENVAPRSNLRRKLMTGAGCALLGGVAVAVAEHLFKLDSLTNIPVTGCPFMLNEEHVLIPQAADSGAYPLHVCYGKKSDMCGYEAFSQPSINCPAVPQNLSKNNYPDIPRRSFGIELELVAREWGSCKHGLSESDYWNCLADMKSTCLPSYFENWNWEYDRSIRVIEEAQAADLVGPGWKAKDEASGFPFEADSPLPPHTPVGKEGLDSVALALDTFKAMGVQSNPSSGFHVHVNVGFPTGYMTNGTYGSQLSTRQVANVWMAYARFQLVIDTHFLQASRVSNRFCRGLVLGRQCVGVWGTSSYSCLGAEEQVTGCYGADDTALAATPAALVFRRMHEFFRQATPDNSTFVDTVYGNEKGWYCPYNGYRYTQLNLEALNKYGTLEFRGLPATYTAERYLAWINFLIHFVERYKDCPLKSTTADACDAFAHDDAELDLELLTRAQATASLEDLALELGESVVSYFRKKPWLSGQACGRTAV